MKIKNKPPPDVSLAAHIIATMMRHQNYFADLGAFYSAQATREIQRALAENISEYGITLLADLRAAQWMALDDDTVRQLLGWCNDLEVPKAVVERSLPLARAPFTTAPTWIEWRMALMPIVPGGPSPAQLPHESAIPADAIPADELMRLAKEDGDHCQGCRREYQNRDVCATGYDASGRLMQVGQCCIDRLVSVVAVSMYFVPNSARAMDQLREANGSLLSPNTRCGVLIRALSDKELAALRKWRADYLQAIGKDPSDDKIEPSTLWSARFFAADPSDPDNFPVSPVCFVVSTDLPLAGVLPEAEPDAIDSIENRGTLLFGLIRAQPEWKSTAYNKFAVRVDELWTAQRKVGGMGDAQIDEQVRWNVDRLAGFGGFILLALALLDQASITYVPRIKNSHRIVAGKLLPGHDHRIVRIPITLQPKEIVRYLGKKIASNVRMREHKVRGHWQRYGSKPHIIWRYKDDYKRGDPALGQIRHDYSLEPPDDGVDEPPDDGGNNG
jgi:hypothetical protein